MDEFPRYAPGRVRDAIVQVLTDAPQALPVREIEQRVEDIIGPTPRSSVRSYLRLNTPELFVREDRGVYRVHHRLLQYSQRELPTLEPREPARELGNCTIYHADCFQWI